MKERYEIDQAHTMIGFSAKHLGVSTVRGQFMNYSGWFEVDSDNPSDASGEVTVDIQSITTGVDMRDDHLRSSDFFEAGTHPQMVYRLTSIERTGEESFTANGELTVRGNTRPLTLRGTLEGEVPNPMGEGRRVGVSAEGEINRMDFGLNWNGVAGAIPLASHKIRIQVDAELVATPVGSATTA